MPSVLEETERLRAQERLLEQALSAGIDGHQRHVQTALLAETRAELAEAARCLRAVEAGWEPFEPSPQWLSGYLDDPRFLRGHVRLASALVAVPLAAALSAGALLAQRLDVVAGVLLAGVLLTSLQAAIHGVLGRVAQERDARVEARQASPRRWSRLHATERGRASAVGFSAVLPAGGDGAEIRLFNAPMPAHAVIAYRRARESGLFDTFTVHSPRVQDFRAVAASEAPSLGLLDPVLAGRIGRRSFLVAQWDLAEDLAEV